MRPSGEGGCGSAGVPDKGLDPPVKRVGGVDVRGVLPASGRPQILAALEASAETVPRPVVVRHKQSILAVVELGREGSGRAGIGGGEGGGELDKI